jgi:Ca-activated chloride channel family protein
MERSNRAFGKLAGILLLLSLCLSLLGQEEKFYVRDGNKAYESGDFEVADEFYSKALKSEPELEVAEFNKADVLYEQKKYAEAIHMLKGIAESSEDDLLRAKSYHNMGNAYLESQKLSESIQAYKNALKLNPEDEETRYNLAYALSKLQQQQQKQNQDNQDKQDQNKDQQKKNDQNKDQQDQQDKNQNKDQQDQQQNQDENQQKSDEPSEQQSQPQPNQLSKEDAERLLNALNNDEKDVQKKLKKKKTQASGKKVEKDW